jgi:hypothetical protein
MENFEEPFEIEAGSLDEALALARSRVPPGYKIASVRILDRGGVRTVRATGDTEETAFARAAIPPRAAILERRTVRTPSRAIQVSALDEPRARALAREKAEPDESLARISVAVPGRKGFLGLGRTPGTYELTFARQAMVEVVVRTEARIGVKLGKLPNKAELLTAIGKSVVQAEIMRATYPTTPSQHFAMGPLRQKLAERVNGIFNSHLDDAKAVFPHDAALQKLQPLAIAPSAGGLDSDGLAAVFDGLCEAFKALVERVAWAEEEPSAPSG